MPLTAPVAEGRPAAEVAADPFSLPDEQAAPGVPFVSWEGRNTALAALLTSAVLASAAYAFHRHHRARSALPRGTVPPIVSG